MLRLSFSTLFLFAPIYFYAQIGGTAVFEYLRLPSSARITALGGNLITVKDDDVGLLYQNPAAANPSMHRQLSLQSNLYGNGIHQGTMTYCHHLNKGNLNLFGGAHFVNYGTFISTDPTGVVQGEFKSNESDLFVGVGKELNEKWSAGLQTKFIFSQLASYQSTGMAFDASLMYADTAKLLTGSIVVRNIGSQLSKYQNASGKEPLPFELQIGISKRLKHLPFRLSVIAHHLQRWDIRYDDPNNQDTGILFSQESTKEKSYFIDKLFRHFVFNGEFLLGRKEVFRLRLGYNHLRRGELLVKGTRGLSGFSFGAGIKAGKLFIDYGYANYHLAQSSHHLGLGFKF